MFWKHLDLNFKKAIKRAFIYTYEDTNIRKIMQGILSTRGWKFATIIIITAYTSQL